MPPLWRSPSPPLSFSSRRRRPPRRLDAPGFGHHRFGGRCLLFSRFWGCTRPVSVVAMYVCMHACMYVYIRMYIRMYVCIASACCISMCTFVLVNPALSPRSRCARFPSRAFRVSSLAFVPVKQVNPVPTLPDTSRMLETQSCEITQQARRRLVRTVLDASAYAMACAPSSVAVLRHCSCVSICTVVPVKQVD